MVNVQEPIDLDRVVVDPAYRRAVIKYLNRETAFASSRAILRSSRGSRRIVDGGLVADQLVGAAAE
ncbi:MAG: hypothetical protein EXQ98_05530 [Alphaproteobacteria bacterium]|nr:hypothetical protein [Alphaproteobacteria bacterium]